MINKIKEWMVWAETYLLWGMIFALVGAGFFIIWEGVADYQKFNRIFQNEHNAESNLAEIEMFNLSFSTFQLEESGEFYRYVTLKSLSSSAPQEVKASLLSQSNSNQPIKGLSGSPSFLINEKHMQFWKSHYTLLLIFKYSAWIFFCLFSGIFGYLNLKQDDKLLTREIQRLFGTSLFVFFIGYFVFEFLNNRTITFLNEQFNLSEPIGIFSSLEMYFVLMLLIIIYSLVNKAIPVQEEQDLTV